jgi:hypothetical protein
MTIPPNTAEITVGFNPDNYEVNEVDGQVELIVEVINGTLERNVSILFETSPGEATEAGEF